MTIWGSWGICNRGEFGASVRLENFPAIGEQSSMRLVVLV